MTAGAIFLGPWSPTVLGDYVAGPSHTLPTGSAGASFAGLTVDQFQRRTSIVEYSAASLKKSLPALAKFAEVEGLAAHGHSASIRLPAQNRKRRSRKSRKLFSRASKDISARGIPFSRKKSGAWSV